MIAKSIQCFLGYLLCFLFLSLFLYLSLSISISLSLSLSLSLSFSLSLSLSRLLAVAFSILHLPSSLEVQQSSLQATRVKEVLSISYLNLYTSICSKISQFRLELLQEVFLAGKHLRSQMYSLCGKFRQSQS